MTEYLNKVINADCLEVMRLLDPEQIGAVLIDAPYRKYNSHHNNNLVGEWAKWRRNTNFAPIMGNDNIWDPVPWIPWIEKTKVIMWGGNFFCDRLPASRSWLVWDKQEGLTPAKYQDDCELAWTNLQGPMRLYHHLWRGICRKGRENISIAAKLHPNQKPVDLAKWTIKQCELPTGSVIFDPYSGSGAFSVAAVEMGYSFIAVDLDPQWIPIIESRISQATAQTRMFV